MYVDVQCMALESCSPMNVELQIVDNSTYLVRKHNGSKSCRVIRALCKVRDDTCSNNESPVKTC